MVTIHAPRYIRIHRVVRLAHQPITGYGFTSTVAPSRSMRPNVCSQRTIAWDVTSALRYNITPPVAKQLKQLYRHRVEDNGLLTVNIVRCTQQPNACDCGVFAVAFLFQWAISSVLSLGDVLCYSLRSATSLFRK